LPCVSARRCKHAYCTLRAEGEQGRLAAALILRLLVTWCDGCPPAVGALLSTPSHLPLIVDMVAGRCDTSSLLETAVQGSFWTLPARRIDGTGCDDDGPVPANMFVADRSPAAGSLPVSTVRLHPALPLTESQHCCNRVARDDPTVCGLAAVLLGLCLLHNPGNNSAQVAPHSRCLSITHRLTGLRTACHDAVSALLAPPLLPDTMAFSRVSGMLTSVRCMFTVRRDVVRMHACREMAVLPRPRRALTRC